MYKLCLFQSPWTKSWHWALQPTEPHDWPFAPDRAEYSGINENIREAIKEAHKLVPRDKVEYVYMDRSIQK